MPKLQASHFMKTIRSLSRASVLIRTSFKSKRVFDKQYFRFGVNRGYCRKKNIYCQHAKIVLFPPPAVSFSQPVLPNSSFQLRYHNQVGKCIRDSVQRISISYAIFTCFSRCWVIYNLILKSCIVGLRVVFKLDCYVLDKEMECFVKIIRDE